MGFLIIIIVINVKPIINKINKYALKCLLVPMLKIVRYNNNNSLLCNYITNKKIKSPVSHFFIPKFNIL